jgi:hypothetical protein
VAESFEQRQPFAPAWSGRKRVDPAILPALSRAADSIQGKMLDVARLSLALGFALVLLVAAAVAAAAAFLTFILVSAVETAPPHMHPPDQVRTAAQSNISRAGTYGRHAPRLTEARRGAPMILRQRSWVSGGAP